jgi:hypothetical protein
VTSGVAGRGAVFGVVRENYAILTFDAEALRVELCSLKVHGRFDLSIPLTKWICLEGRGNDSGRTAYE